MLNSLPDANGIKNIAFVKASSGIIALNHIEMKYIPQKRATLGIHFDKRHFESRRASCCCKLPSSRTNFQHLSGHHIRSQQLKFPALGTGA
jgi:hypothetical protein